jgi:uncharacterized protein
LSIITLKASLRSMTTGAATRATLAELMSRPSQCEPEHTAEIFGETVAGDVPGATRVPWTGARTSRDEVPAYFSTPWSVCDTANTDNAVSQVLVDVVLGAFTQTIRATGRRFSTPVALHVDDRLVTWLRVHEDSHAVAGAYAGHP